MTGILKQKRIGIKKFAGQLKIGEFVFDIFLKNRRQDRFILWNENGVFFCVTGCGGCFLTELFVDIGGNTFMDSHIFRWKIVIIFGMIEEKFQRSFQ